MISQLVAVLLVSVPTYPSCAAVISFRHGKAIQPISALKPSLQELANSVGAADVKQRPNHRGTGAVSPVTNF
jgi:hypothetical protein